MFKSLHNSLLTATFAVLILLVSCGKGKVQLPLNDTELIEMLCDVHIMEGALQNISNRDKDSVAQLYYQQIYEKHTITESDFIVTLELLEDNPKKLEKIYSQVLLKLDTLEEESYKSKYKKK